MKFISFFTRKNRKEKTLIRDFYQDSIDKMGRDQIQKLVDKGLSIPVFYALAR